MRCDSTSIRKHEVKKNIYILFVSLNESFSFRVYSYQSIFKPAMNRSAFIRQLLKWCTSFTHK